jgi:hypothetical protein
MFLYNNLFNLFRSNIFYLQVEEDGEAQGGAEDSWVSLYRWYASILERTGHAMLMISPPSSPGKDGTFLEKIDVNCRDYYCRTAVHYAAEQGHDDILITLLDAGLSQSSFNCNL